MAVQTVGRQETEGLVEGSTALQQPERERLGKAMMALIMGLIAAQVVGAALVQLVAKVMATPVVPVEQARHQVFLEPL